MKQLLTASTILFSIVLLSSCDYHTFKEDKIFAGNKIVKAETLNKGKAIYKEYCMACHGAQGKGDGVASKGMHVPPRDFTIGVYKFGDVLAGELPHDQSFFDTLEHGLKGTAMLPWDLTHGQMDAVVQYIKTFAMETWEGKDKKLGKRIVPVKDPYGLARRSSAIERGKEVYHVVAQCQTCHRAYLPKAEINEISQKLFNEDAFFGDDLYKVKPQESEHGYKTIPPDFTWHEVRSASTVKELYVRIAAGVGGTAMPAWKGTISDEDIWAVSYYVKHLMDMKSTEEREALFSNLK